MLSWLILILVLIGPVSAIQGAHPLELRLEFEPALAALESQGQTEPGAAGTSALVRAADLADALDHPERAAAALLLAAERLPADPRVPDWRLRAGAGLHRIGQADPARAALTPLVAVGSPLRPTGAQRARAWLLLGRLDLAAGRLRRGRERLAKVVAAWDRAADADRLALSAPAAEAACRLAELDVSRLDWALPPPVGPDRLKPWLEKKLGSIDTAAKSFDRVFRHGDLRWTARAAFGRARLLIRFQHWLWDFPPPPGLSPEELEAYRQALSDHAYSFEANAIVLLEKVIWMVAEHHLAADIGRQARGELDRIEPKLRWWHLRFPKLPAPLPIDPANPRRMRAAARLAEVPGDPEALLLGAEGLLVDGRPRVARYVLGRLIPPSLEQRLLLVRALIGAGDDRALELAHGLSCELTRDNPNLVPAWRLRAELEIAFGDLAGAGRSLVALERLGDTQVELRAGRAIVLVGQAKLPAAREALETLVTTAPARADLHHDLALVLMAAGRAASAPAERIALVRRAADHLKRAQALAGGRDPDITKHRLRAAETLQALEATLGDARKLAPSREEL